ncbi:MAG: oligosaccharide flippase family protein [Anaerolineae bacterium]|nr:oligosaccharide flippase family protein [Anaerolineae bacterium]
MIEKLRARQGWGGRALARVSVNAAALLIGQAGARVLNLVLIARLTRALGLAALGRYLLAMTAQAIALAAADLGLSTYATRELARREGLDAEAIWGTVLGLKLAAVLIAVLALDTLVASLFPEESRVLIWWASASLLPDAFSAAATALIKARQRMAVSSAIGLATRTLYVLAGLTMLWRGYGAQALLIAYSAVGTMGAAAYAVVLRRWDVHARWSALAKRWRAVLGESVPFALTSLVTMLYTRLDLLVLSYWHGDVAAGVYGSAYRLWEALGMIPASYLDAFFPELARSSGEAGGRARLRALYTRGRRVLWVAIPLLVVPCLLLATPIISLLYGRTAETAVSSALFRVLLCAFPMTYLYLLDGHALYAAGQQRHVTVVMIAVTALNALANLLLIPRWSYWAAVGVALGSESLILILLHSAVRRAILRPQVDEAAA